VYDDCGDEERDDAGVEVIIVLIITVDDSELGFVLSKGAPMPV